jgi:predicted nucleic acid-binding protein
MDGRRPVTALVLDASAALSFLISTQATEASEAFRLTASGYQLIAPAFFSAEMRHALLKLERRRLIAPQVIDVELLDLETLVDVAPVPSARGLVRLTALARTDGLGLYDAAYLALAMDRACPLASRDAVLLGAATLRGLSLYDLR